MRGEHWCLSFRYQCQCQWVWCRSSCCLKWCSLGLPGGPCLSRRCEDVSFMMYIGAGNIPRISFAHNIGGMRTGVCRTSCSTSCGCVTVRCGAAHVASRRKERELRKWTSISRQGPISEIHDFGLRWACSTLLIILTWRRQPWQLSNLLLVSRMFTNLTSQPQYHACFIPLRRINQPRQT
jgi:hypothetical protein